MQLNSLINLLRVVLPIVVLSGCTEAALQLPEDYGSINSKPLDSSSFQESDLQLTCGQIEEEKTALKNQRAAIRNNIVAGRDGDQIVGYVASVAFPPLWFAVDNQSDRKAQIRLVENRLDTLYRLTRFRSCSVAGDAKVSKSGFEYELDQLASLRQSGAISEEEHAQLRMGIFKKYYPEGFD